MEGSVYDALLARALQAVLDPDDEAFLRRVKRFYSRTFHVPLPRVDDLDEVHVLTAYFEEICEQMSDEERVALAHKLIETPEERVSRLEREKEMEQRDEAFLEELNRQVKEGKSRGPKEPPKPKLKVPGSALSAVEKARAIRDRIKAGIEKPAPEPPKLPDIHMDFSDGGNLPDIPPEFADLDPVGPAKK
jgi:hypothetical protein